MNLNFYREDFKDEEKKFKTCYSLYINRSINHQFRYACLCGRMAAGCQGLVVEK